MPNTGYKAYNNLKLVYLDNREYLGETKVNSPSDPDYIAPVYDPYFCPLPSPPSTPSRTPSKTPSVTPSVTVSRTLPATPSVTPTVTPSVTVSRSVPGTPSETPTITPSLTPTPTPSSNGTYTVTIFAANDPGLAPNSTKAQYSTNGYSGWVDFGPFSGYSNVCTFKGQAEFNPGDDVYIRIIGTGGQWYEHGASPTTSCPFGSSGNCIEFISSISSDAVRSFYVSTNTTCP